MLSRDSYKSVIVGSPSRRLGQLYSHIYPYSRMQSTYTLQKLKKTSSFTETLAPDPEIPNVDIAKNPDTPRSLFHSARILKSGAFTWLLPEKRKEYKYLTASHPALADLGLDPERETKSDYFRMIVGGQKVETDPFPYSQAYAGYQFGTFAGQLGDGRVVNLFEVTNPNTGKVYELQLKGAGKTPFSRFADGKAVLRSSIREFVISESLNAIGIPSTRALAITALPKTYAQRGTTESCAIVCRMAPSWIRVGTFDLYRYRNDRQGLIALADYAIDHVFHGEKNLCKNFKSILGKSEILQQLGTLSKYDKLYLEIVCRNAEAVSYWQAYGFLNGVLNTDNTSILGLAMDFGPFSFMDYFEPSYTPNTDDVNERYSFRSMPSAIWFNMVKLAEDLVELLGAGPELLKDHFFQEKGLKQEWIKSVGMRTNKMVQAAADIFESYYMNFYMTLLCKRLGISMKSRDQDGILLLLFETLQKSKLDYNGFFVLLQKQPLCKTNDSEISNISAKFIPDNFEEDQTSGYTKSMVKGIIERFLIAFKKRLVEEDITDAERLRRAEKYNPLFIPKNWILNEVIDFTQKNNYDSSYLDKLMKMCCNPYEPEKWGDELGALEQHWLDDNKKEKQMLQCSCSS